MDGYVTTLNSIASTLRDDDAVSGVLLELYANTNLSYNELADRSGVSRSMAWDVMHGKKRPSVVVWSRLAKALTDAILGIND